MTGTELPAYEFSISPLEPGELNFLLKSWKEGLAEYRPLGLTRDAYFRYQSAVCDEVMSRFPIVLCARSLLERDLVLGYIVASQVASGFVAWHCYVKAAYKRRGIARGLLSAVTARLGGDKRYHVTETRIDDVVRRHGFEFMDVERALRLEKQS